VSDSYAHALRALLTGLVRGLEAGPVAEVALQVSKKRCKRCLAEKPASAFHTHNGSPDGLQSWCKRCLLRQQRLARAASAVARTVQHREETLARVEHGKACLHCEVVKPLPEFGVDRRKPDGRQSTCKACAAPARRQPVRRIEPSDCRRLQNLRRKPAHLRTKLPHCRMRRGMRAIRG
jgi:hypothetical protein